MLQKHRSALLKPFQAILALLAAFFFLSLPPAHAQDACEAALQSTQGIVDLQPDSPFPVERGVAEWESEILKVRVARSGLLSLEVESGPEAEAALQAGGTSGLQLVDGASLKPGSPFLTLVVPEEVYCLRVLPQPGAEGALQVRIDFIDLCKLDPGSDDHGDSFACASDLLPDDDRAGSISTDDRDVFAFTLEADGAVQIQNAGGSDVSGRLFDDKGVLLAADDGGSEAGFLISHTLPAGRYFVRVDGENGAAGPYTLSLDQVP